MKYCVVIAVLLLVVGCQSDVQPPARAMGMPNPASVYCVEKGGTRVAQKSAQGESSLCQLPDGEQVEEWTLWRREHPQKQ
ncbi:putative hemolysin [Pseudocitrobacter cyperus]|uniref:DUF333 domain-containing protein n=1 Tax=Pseudocitrobacter cyperus TaxID=3112843 RepID=A0ABV0HHH7_9ENTR